MKGYAFLDFTRKKYISKLCETLDKFRNNPLCEGKQENLLQM